jgi:hypothetical protein
MWQNHYKSIMKYMAVKLIRGMLYRDVTDLFRSIRSFFVKRNYLPNFYQIFSPAAVWTAGKEGRTAGAFLQSRHPNYGRYCLFTFSVHNNIFFCAEDAAASADPFYDS